MTAYTFVHVQHVLSSDSVPCYRVRCKYVDLPCLKRIYWRRDVTDYVDVHT